MEYKSEVELYNHLKGAFNVKIRMISDTYGYINKPSVPKDVSSFIEKGGRVIVCAQL